MTSNLAVGHWCTTKYPEKKQFPKTSLAVVYTENVACCMQYANIYTIYIVSKIPWCLVDLVTCVCVCVCVFRMH